jgi:hypothetical protein
MSKLKPMWYWTAPRRVHRRILCTSRNGGSGTGPSAWPGSLFRSGLQEPPRRRMCWRRFPVQMSSSYPPSNPVVSIGTIVDVPGIRKAIQATSAPVVGISPIVSGAAVRGMAEACLSAIGVRTAADSVAMHYGARASGGILDAWLMDSADAGLSDSVARSGVRPIVVPLWMNDVRTSANIAAATLDAASAVAAAES